MGYRYCKEGHIMDPSWKVCPVCLAPLAGWFLEVDENGRSRKFYTIHEGKSFVGSGAECEIRILGKDLARQNACISVANGECDVVDLGASGAMRVNGVAVSHSSLIDGDEISFGDAKFRVKLI